MKAQSFLQVHLTLAVLVRARVAPLARTLHRRVAHTHLTVVIVVVKRVAVVGREEEAAAVLDLTPHHLRLLLGQVTLLKTVDERRGSIHLNHPNVHQAVKAGEVLRMRMKMHPRQLVPVAGGEGVFHHQEVIRKETGHLLVHIHPRHVTSLQGAVGTRMMAVIGSVVVGQDLIVEVCPPAVSKQECS